MELSGLEARGKNSYLYCLIFKSKQNPTIYLTFLFEIIELEAIIFFPLKKMTEIEWLLLLLFIINYC